MQLLPDMAMLPEERYNLFLSKTFFFQNTTMFIRVEELEILH